MSVACDHVANTFEQKPEPKAPELPAARLTKAEKRAQHQQLQKDLWASAENPGRNLWLEAQGAVPLKQEPKQPMMVLSRKPAAKNRDDGEDSEEEARKKKEASFEERKKRAAIEREEKVKKYAEARERIMGSSNSGSPAPNSRESSQGRDNRKPRGKQQHSNMNSQPTSTAHSPARQAFGGGGSQVFDPEDMGRRLGPRREMTSTPKEGEPTRQPRGPDSSGRGGFGFAARGGAFSA